MHAKAGTGPHTARTNDRTHKQRTQGRTQVLTSTHTSTQYHTERTQKHTCQKRIFHLQENSSHLKWAFTAIYMLKLTRPGIFNTIWHLVYKPGLLE